MKSLNNKRAQMGETITWIIATIIIIIILAVSIFIASLIPSAKIFSSETSIDLFAKQSLSSYLLTKGSSGNLIYNEISQSGNFDDSNGNLSANIFKNLYSGYYNSAVNLDILDNAKQVIGQQNKYFTFLSVSYSVGIFAPSIDYKIKLNNDDKFIQLILW